MSGLTFNHYGIQARNSNDYEAYIENFGGLYGEVKFKGRRIATLKHPDLIIEIYEPKHGEVISNTVVDHVAYISSDFAKHNKIFEDKKVSSFDVGNTRGFKCKPAKDILIEIRNNNILDSVKDFKS